jgi:hypothetical protein
VPAQLLAMGGVYAAWRAIRRDAPPWMALALFVFVLVSVH